MNTPTGNVSCAHEGCVCVIPRDKALQRDRQYYCSEECMSGRGCNHGDCDCGPTMVAEQSSHEVGDGSADAK